MMSPASPSPTRLAAAVERLEAAIAGEALRRERARRIEAAARETLARVEQLLEGR